jgi:hypothetical protein
MASNAAEVAPDFNFTGPKLLNIILDIDETFVHFVGLDDFNKIPEGDRALYLTSPREGKKQFWILRPGYEKFFQFLHETCKTINFWTLSDIDYANETKALIEKNVKVVNKRNSDGTVTYKPIKIGNVWVDTDNDRVEADEDYGNTKDLRYIWDNYKAFTPGNTILVDDVQVNTQNTSNKFNGIQLLPFNPCGLRSARVDQTPLSIRKGPIVNMLNDKELERVQQIILNAANELCSKSRPFCTPQKLSVNPEHGGRRKTRRKRRNYRTRNTKTRR